MKMKMKKKNPLSEKDNNYIKELEKNKYEIITDEEIKERRKSMYEDEEVGIWY